MNDLVTISKEALMSELTTMIRQEISATSASSKRINDSLMSPENIQHHLRIADIFAQSEMVPKNYIGKPTNILIAWEMGHQLGLPYMQALQDIAVINGKPCLYGDGFVAVIKSHKDYEWMKEGQQLNDQGVAIGYYVTLKRRNHEPHTEIFTLDDARKAKLLNKPGPWTDYPMRMMKWRATSWCGRNVFADALRGVKSAEEEMDFIDGEFNEVPQTSQTEQLKQLLKGRSNEESKIGSSPVVSAPVPASNDVAKSSAKPLPKQPNASNNQSPVVEVREPNTDANPQEARADGITETQLADIHMLMSDKKIDPSRIDALLKKVPVNSLEELSKKDADRILTWLEKAQ